MPKRPRSVCDIAWSQNIIHIPTSNYIQICSGLDLAGTETVKPGVKVTVTWKQVVTCQGPIFIYVQIWICYHKQYRRSAVGAFFHNLASWLLRSRSQWLKTVSDIPWHVIWGMLLTLCFACCRWVFLSVNCFVPIHTTVMLTVCYIDRQPGRGYHFSKTNACGNSAASKNDHCTN